MKACVIENTDVRQKIYRQTINIETREQERRSKMGGMQREREDGERSHFLSTVYLHLALPPSGEAERARDSVCPCRL